MKPLTCLIGQIVLFGLLPALVLGSAGDNDNQFKTCVSICEKANCMPWSSFEIQIPLLRKLMFWTCPQECDYACQQEITAERVDHGMPILQYHGKWPFVRLAGIQEPASVLFSLLNLVPHYRGLHVIRSKRIFRNDPTIGVYLQKYYQVFALIGINTWIWSSVFHCRDFVLTERLDYFSAILSILYAFFTASVRVFRLDTPERKNWRYFFAACCITFYACHVGYLAFIHFSYSYNMAAMVVVGLIQNVMWIYLSISMYRSTKERWTIIPTGITTAITLAMGLELFDFPPVWYTFDAHSLWHAATIIPTFWWYNWMERDMYYLKRQKRL